ncbi:MAG: GGDEF domain-containing protein [Clostridia bacterium]|nr:GGDEF domain-containing protein [Clostridia bacterium]
MDSGKRIFLADLNGQSVKTLDDFEKFLKETVFEYDMTENRLYVCGLYSEKFERGEVIPKLSEDPRVRSVLNAERMSEITGLILSATPEVSEIRHVCRLNLTGEERWYGLLIKVSFTKGVRDGFFCKLTDVNETYKHFLKLRYDAHHDGLTGLYRRNYAKNQILQKLGGSGDFVIIMLDLDYFKGINDNYGHAFGDRVLKAVADIALKTFRSDGTVIARVGGDEFMLFMEYVDSPMEKVKKFQNAMITDIYGITVSVSMGVADTKIVGRDYEQLYACADKALYVSKRFGRGICCYYDPSASGGYVPQKPDVNISAAAPESYSEKNCDR